MEQQERYHELIRAALGDDERGCQLADALRSQVPDLQSLKELSYEQIDEIASWSPRMVRLLAAIKLGRLTQLSQRKLLGHAYSSFELSHEMIDRFAGREQESVCLVLTNVHNDIIDLDEVFKGGQSECQLYPEQIYRRALLKAASGLAIVHNHPSGNVEPSSQDMKMISRLQKGCRLLNLHFLDFMIVGLDSYYSWQENQTCMKRRIS